MPFTFVYNAYAAAMRSVGDSRTPIRFLALASVLNAGLDVAFVAGLHWGAVGAGIATVLAESLSAILCVIYTERNLAALRLTRACLLYTSGHRKGRTAYRKSRARRECGTDCRKNKKEKRSEKSHWAFAK